MVTEFEFRLHPVGPIVLGGMLAHPGERAGEVLRFFREFMAQAPDVPGGGQIARVPEDAMMIGQRHAAGTPT